MQSDLVLLGLLVFVTGFTAGLATGLRLFRRQLRDFRLHMIDQQLVIGSAQAYIRRLLTALEVAGVRFPEDTRDGGRKVD